MAVVDVRSPWPPARGFRWPRTQLWRCRGPCSGVHGPRHAHDDRNRNHPDQAPAVADLGHSRNRTTHGFFGPGGVGCTGKAHGGGATVGGSFLPAPRGVLARTLWVGPPRVCRNPTACTSFEAVAWLGRATSRPGPPHQRRPTRGLPLRYLPVFGPTSSRQALNRRSLNHRAELHGWTQEADQRLRGGTSGSRPVSASSAATLRSSRLECWL